MIIPVRCFTCGKILAHSWMVRLFDQLQREQVEMHLILDRLQLKNECCRSIYLTTVEPDVQLASILERQRRRRTRRRVPEDSLPKPKKPKPAAIREVPGAGGPLVVGDQSASVPS